MEDIPFVLALEESDLSTTLYDCVRRYNGKTQLAVWRFFWLLGLSSVIGLLPNYLRSFLHRNGYFGSRFAIGGFQ